GVLCNPMLQPHASQVALATAADFLCAPEEYDPAASWPRAIAAVGKSRAPALQAMAAACADGPLLPPEQLEAHTLVTALADATSGPAWPDAVRVLRDHLTAVQDAGRVWTDADDDPLAAELEPWLASASVEVDAGLAALRLIQHTYPVAHIDPDGNGNAVLPDAEQAMVHAFATLFSWSAARRRKHVVFGPRFAIYPAVVQLADGRPGLDIDLAVVEGQSAIDRLCRVALARYQVWAERSPESLRVRVAGEPVAVASNGAFSAPGAQTVVVEAGPDATEVTGAESILPFPDSRLA
ncbi:MAG TPA: beta-N-acetylglucosaminidase domain-containing protein, partial [Acidimicrobiia bacterium]|nr:beta-N-acetylglucosaminidase domain-containing protein [Acidimicrobiia bacterium]